MKGSLAASIGVAFVSPRRRLPAAAVVFGEQTEGTPMSTQDSREGATKRTVIQTIRGRLDDDLVTDQCQTNFASGFDLHRRGEVSRKENAQAAANPLHTFPERHTDKLDYNFSGRGRRVRLGVCLLCSASSGV